MPAASRTSAFTDNTQPYDFGPLYFSKIYKLEVCFN